MASSSSGENVMGIFGAMNDRFSSLPDALAHQILSFVNVDEFGSVMLVSKRLNQLCFSAPCLSMVNNSSTDDSSHRARLDRFFTAYFSRRRQYGSKVQRLRILWSFHQAKAQALEYGRGQRRKREVQDMLQRDCDADDPVFRCLYLCGVCCDPEHVELNFVLREGGGYVGRAYKKNKIAEYSFTTFVRNLVLSTNNIGFQLDPRYSFPSRLESLTLQSVGIVCNDAFYFGIEQFPKLKVLRLYDCSGRRTLRILNHSLERVEIVNEKVSSDLYFLQLSSSELRTLFITWYPASLVGTVHMYLPRLEHLEWKGFPLMYTNNIAMHTIHEHMKSATIYCVWPFKTSLVCADMYDSFVTQCVRSAKSLHMLAKTIEVFILQFNKKNDPFSLGVETLHIDDCYLTDAEVHEVSLILKMMPDLKNISVSSSRVHKHIRFKSKNKVKACIPQEESGFKLDYWEALNLKCVQQLETATVQIHKEQGNAAELVKYLAKHGERLENLKVICPSAMVSAVSSQIEAVKSNAANVIYVQGMMLGEELEMEDGDEIEAMLHQTGGATAMA